MAIVSLFLWTIVFVGGSIALGVGGLLLVRRVVKLPAVIEENEVAGFMYAVVGVIYGVLLAFVVFAVWERYSAVDSSLTDEAAVLVEVYRDTTTFPEPSRQQAQDALRTYANSVMTTELATHGELLPHTTPDLLNSVWRVYRLVQPSNDLENDRLQGAEGRLHDLELRRHLRHLSEETTLPWLFWPILVGGGLVTLAFSYLFHLQNLRIQMEMTALLSGLIGGVLLLIFSLNQPYTGPFPVSKQPFEHALLQFHAIDLSGPGSAEGP